VNARAFSKIDKPAFYRFMQVRREGRYELDRGYIVQQMTGGTLRHSRITARLVQLITQQCDGARWIVLQDRGVDTPQTVRYPDVVVEPVGALPESLATTTPALIIEVLSPSTTSIDLNTKPTEYLELKTLQAYIVASQTDAACLAWIRGADGAFGVTPVEYGAGEVIAIPLPSVSISVADIYAGIDISSQDTAPHG
jgi:Uma2 family endonuclease